MPRGPSPRLRTSRLPALALLVALGATLSTRPVAAQPTAPPAAPPAADPSTPPSTEAPPAAAAAASTGASEILEEDLAERAAREVFEQAVTAFRRGEPELALRLFRAAVRITPLDFLRFNVGVCLQALGRHREALLELQAVSGGDARPEVRERAREIADEVRRELGEVVLTGEPLAAEVRVDGELRCVLPCITVEMPGPHELEVRAEGRVPSARRVTVARAQRVGLRFELPPLPPGPWQPHPLTWAGAFGASLFALSGIGLLVASAEMHRAYTQGEATESLRETGLLTRDLGIASFGVTAAGLTLLVIGLALGGPEAPAAPPPE